MPSGLPPNYTLGRNLTGVSVAGVVNNGDGTYTVSTIDYSDLHLGYSLDGFRINPMNESEDITPVDVKQRNNVTVTSDFRVEVSEIRQTNYNSILMEIWNSFDYVRFQRNYSQNAGGVYEPNTFIVIARVAEPTETAARGKTVISMSCDSCGLPPYYGPLSEAPF